MDHQGPVRRTDLCLRTQYDIAFRNAVPNDLKELQQLFIDTVSSVCKADYNAEQIKEWTSSIENKSRWSEIISKQFVLVAQLTDKIVGFATLDKGVYIYLFYVHKDFQGQGIARKLYAKIEEEAKRQEQTELTCDVSKTARPFFRKVGFEVIKEQIVVRQNVELINLKMKKRLNE